jgi:hypothetical protein
VHLGIVPRVDATDHAGRAGDDDRTVLGRAYEMVADDEDHGRGELPDDVAKALPGNAGRQVLALGLQQAGDLVVDPRTVLVWLLGALGAPAAMAGLLVPIRESGSMLPQLALVGWVRRKAIRKWVWILGACLQATCTVGLAVVALSLEGIAAGVVVLVLVGGFALARALNSIATKDVLGKTVPKGVRGRITGAAAIASGAVAITLGVALRTFGGDEADPSVFAALLVGGAVSWVLAAITYSRVVEEPGEVDADDDASAAAGRAWALVRDDADFRTFVIARGLLLVSALSPPFVVALASASGDGGLGGLGPFIIGSGIAGLVGGRLWGGMADRSSRLVMVRAAASASVVIVLLLVALRVPALADGPLLFPAAYLLLALAHAGSRIGRKTYVVDLAEGNQRTDYVAVSNTLMGLILLVTGGVTAAVATAGAEWGLAVLVGLGAMAVVVARRLPEVSAG